MIAGVFALFVTPALGSATNQFALYAQGVGDEGDADRQQQKKCGTLKNPVAMYIHPLTFLGKRGFNR